MALIPGEDTQCVGNMSITELCTGARVAFRVLLLNMAIKTCGCTHGHQVVGNPDPYFLSWLVRPGGFSEESIRLDPAVFSHWVREWRMCQMAALLYY